MQIFGRRFASCGTSEHCYMTHLLLKQRLALNGFATTLQHALPQAWLIVMKAIDIQPPYALQLLLVPNPNSFESTNTERESKTD